MTHSAAAGTGRAAAATRGDAHTPPTLYPPHCSSLCSSPFLIAFLPPSFTVPLLISHERRPRTGDHSDEDEHEESKQVTAAPYSQEEESALLEEAVQSNSVKFYNHCISEAAKRKNLRFALRLYEALRRKGVEPNVFTYSALINACVRGGDLTRAWAFVEEMRAAGIAPNEVTWTTLLKAYCDIVLDTRPVLSLVAQMEACGVRPNLRTFNTILRGCLRTGDAATAKAIWDRLELGDPVKPDASSRDSMIKIYIQDGNLYQAYDTFTLLQSRNTRIHPLSLIQLSAAFALRANLDLARYFYDLCKGADLGPFAQEINTLDEFFSSNAAKSLPPYIPMAQDPMVQVIDRANPAPLAAFPFPNRKVGIKLEFCSGTGTWIIDRCKAHPEENWIALEIRFDRVFQIWTKARLFGLRNLGVVCGDAHTAFAQCLAPHSLDELYCSFPEPPLESDAESRDLFAPNFIKAMCRVLKPEHAVRVLTDDAAYAAVIDRRFRALGLTLLDQAEAEFEHKSFFDHLWQDKARPRTFVAATIPRDIKFDETEQNSPDNQQGGEKEALWEQQEERSEGGEDAKKRKEERRKRREERRRAARTGEDEAAHRKRTRESRDESDAENERTKKKRKVVEHEGAEDNAAHAEATNKQKDKHKHKNEDKERQKDTEEDSERDKEKRKKKKHKHKEEQEQGQDASDAEEHDRTTEHAKKAKKKRKREDRADPDEVAPETKLPEPEIDSAEEREREEKERRRKKKERRKEKKRRKHEEHSASS